MALLWYVARLQPGKTTLAVANLRYQGYTTAVPMIPVEHRRGHHKVVDQRPLLEGYAFVRFDREVDRWRSINGTRGVVKLLPLHAENPIAVEDELVAFVMALPQVLREREEYGRGAEVRITAGVYEGKVGVCLWRGRRKVGVYVNGLLARESVVKVHPHWVELAAKPPIVPPAG